MQSISAALDAVDAKKQTLREAFQSLERASASSPDTFSLHLQWSHLEAHLDSLAKSLRVRLAKSDPAAQPDSDHYRNMKSLCVNSDALGLRSYILRHQGGLLKESKSEVGAALAAASDPAELILDAVESFYGAEAEAKSKAGFRSVCNLLLEQLSTISPHVRPGTRARARELAVEWKAKARDADQQRGRGESRFPIGSLAFLQLVASYGLASEFEEGPELVDFAASVAWRKFAVELIRALDIKHKIPDLIEKLISNEREFDAIKFIYAFELVNKFPPVPLLRNHLKRSVKAAQNIRQKGKDSGSSLKVAEDKELSALRAVIKCIEEHNLDSEYPRGTLDDRVGELVRQQAHRKSSATIPPVEKEQQQQQQQQQSTNKRPRLTATETLSSNTPPILPSPVQQTSSGMGGFPPASPYMSSPPQYGFIGTNPGVPNYMMTSAPGLYGLGAHPVNYGLGAHPVNYGLVPPGSQLYANPNMPNGFYDWPGFHGMPPFHHPSFYP